MWFQLEVPSTLCSATRYLRKPQMGFQLQECGYKISFQAVSYQPLLKLPRMLMAHVYVTSLGKAWASFTTQQCKAMQISVCCIMYMHANMNILLNMHDLPFNPVSINNLFKSGYQWQSCTCISTCYVRTGLRAVVETGQVANKMMTDTIFLWSDAWLLSYPVCFSAATTRGRLLFEGGIYFVGKLVYSNDDWIRYMQAIQLGPDRRW